jgi:hypothetical protein
MKIDKNEELKYRNYNNKELENLIYNQAKLVCERDMGIIFPDKLSKEMEEFNEKFLKEVIEAIKSTFPSKA